MADDGVYQGFIEWLGNAWPLPEADGLLGAIKARYTPEDAAFLTGFPFQATRIGDLAKEKQLDQAELTARLDGLARQGVVFRSERGGDIRYRLNDAFFVYLRSSFWTGSADAPLPEVAKQANKYYYNGFFDNWEDVHTRGLRTLPIHETIADKRQILPFEDVVRVVEDLEYHTVSHCPCRQRKNLDDNHEDCGHPTEVCLHFGDLGRYCVENGLGRKIEKEETVAILRKAAESGLVHGLSNWQEGADTICNCCKCCCMWLEAYHVLGHHASLSPSNYRVVGESGECIACGRCVDRCPMEAQSLQPAEESNSPTGEASVVDRAKCIGCGVCVVTCPVEALTLVRIEDPDEPPKDAREFGMRFAQDNQARIVRKQKESKQ